MVKTCGKWVSRILQHRKYCSSGHLGAEDHLLAWLLRQKIIHKSEAFLISLSRSLALTLSLSLTHAHTHTMDKVSSLICLFDCAVRLAPDGEYQDVRIHKLSALLSYCCGHFPVFFPAWFCSLWWLALISRPHCFCQVGCYICALYLWTLKEYLSDWQFRWLLVGTWQRDWHLTICVVVMAL